jgi:transcriptional regulator with XRE-family HTH domain
MVLDPWLKAFAMKAGAIIRDARKQKGWSQKDLADRVGVSQVAIMKIENGQTTKSKHFPKIAQVLNLELSDLDPSLSPVSNRTDMKLTGSMKKPQVERFKQEHLIGAHDLPVFSLAQGGPGALVLSNEPFRTIGRPHNLLNVEKAFGVLIVGDSMFPEYREGDIAYVDPHVPPRSGDACLFQSDRDGTVEAVIKYLDKSPHHSPDVWHVRQHNPEKRYTLKKEDWQKCYVLVGKQSGR